MVLPDRKLGGLDYEQIHAREVVISETLFTSATTTRAAREILGLDGSYGGVTIIDLAAGASSLIPNLLEKEGARGYAVDHLYGDYQKLLTAIESSFPKVIEQTPPRYRDHMESLTRQAIEEFLVSFQTRRDRYLQGWLTKLPIEDNTSDIAVSLNGISLLAKDEDVMRVALREAIRVTRKGGLITIAPFYMTGVNSSYVEVCKRLAQEIGEKRLGEVRIVRPTKKYLEGVLRIVKR